MYICQICNKNPATVHLTDIHNNVKKELHMCEECAGKKGFSIKHNINIPGMISSGDEQPTEKKKTGKDITCNDCGMSWSEFRANGRFGCAKDYEAFKEKLLPLISDIQANEMEHVGKHPAGAENQSSKRREVIECRKQLREAVEREAYEEAAKLRDKLKELEDEMSK
ncbi:MAG: UvrB/UvrC motif-containing protein [Planctomycetes bacterium]|nr:UvrB/UvrC motif-containing protein [Planctomycetota bacterium]